ncbi:MAG TPA: DUF4450 domain-containing protein [Lacunisphaera sp.]|nr:DUF4450 domain-containing protein [Lacunisphaera sp.]
MCNIIRYTLLGSLAVILAGAGRVEAQAPAAQKLTPNLVGNIDRPLRYRPDGPDFVIENGAEFFNRPLYGGNTAFRVDGGDKPEFVLYLPGRGGNLRLGIRRVERADPGALAPAKWLHEAANITSRYRPGELLYEIRDPLLGPDGVLRLAVVAWHQAEGLGLWVEAQGLVPRVEFVWAYGGVNGQRGRRDGDIGTENVPIAEWFQLQPEFARKNQIELGDAAFTLRASLPRDQTANIQGLVPAGTTLTIGDASLWNDLPALLAAKFVKAPDLPVVVGRVPLANAAPLYFSIQRVGVEGATPDLDTYQEAGAKVERAAPQRASSAAVQTSALGSNALHLSDLPAAFAATEAHFAALRNRVKVETPDPYLNAAVGALNVAADAVWDEPQQGIMHGAIAWRTRLLGWRGPYALDALGWTDRARQHFEYWATRQNTDPIPDKLPPPDASSNLARSETALHSNGDLSNSHYDMNLVYIDALFRHLLWTGDVAFAKKMWPVIERHLAWERRLFRREFTTPSGEKLPLYEAYAAIWASDDLQYSGGGAAHSSAYNYWHNRMAARVAPLAGADPLPFAKEANLIARGMRQLLWTSQLFAEYKDLLGRQLVHPSAGLWTFYHTMDAGLPTRDEATRMALRLPPLIPVRGQGVPQDRPYAVRTSTDWMPYTWSLNNVVMGENIHAALGLWQAERPEEAYTLMKSALLASMFIGICPGNVGSMNYLDVYRRESQRDFADGSGVTSRALVEGLFGLRPDALAGELLVAPGFPAEWYQARLHHPMVDFSYVRQGLTETFVVEPRLVHPPRLRLQLPASGEPVQIAVNGRTATATRIDGPSPRWEIVVPATTKAEVSVTWNGPIRSAEPNPVYPEERFFPAAAGQPIVGEKTDTIDLTPYFNDRVTEIFRPGKYRSPRSPFVSLALPAQGIGYWAGHANATAEIDDTGLRAVSGRNGGRITLPNGLPFATPGPGQEANIVFVSQWDNYPRQIRIPLAGQARRLHLLMAGTTNAMQSRLTNGNVVVDYADNESSVIMSLRNPDTWWPIEQDYFIDDYQFSNFHPYLSPRTANPLPIRVDLKTGKVRVLDYATFKGQGGVVPGGAAMVLDIPLDPNLPLKSLTISSWANDVIIGLMAATLER